MTLSLFTPCHNSTYMQALYDSIKDQPWDEWIIAWNNGAVKVDLNDPRIKYFDLGETLEWVGPLKAFCCEQVTSDIMLEMDCDDELTSTAIEDIKAAFEQNPTVGVVYANTIHCDKEYNSIQRFDTRYGWEYRVVDYKGHQLDEHLHFEMTPSAMSRIFFMMNHPRSWLSSVYRQVGGYSKRMKILDDADLACRMYLVTKFYHINKGLYVYRVHGENSWIRYNAEIQENVYRIHDQYIESLAEKWSVDNGLSLIELGGRINAKAGYTTVDLKDADVITDLNDTWPFDDGSVGSLRAYDVFEHLKDPIHTMKELYRVLAPGGYAFIQVPSTEGRGAAQDPTHVSFWNQNSFLYYTYKRWNQYIDCPVRFQALRCYTTEKNAEEVCWTRAHLMKIPEGVRIPGEVNI